MAGTAGPSISRAEAVHDVTPSAARLTNSLRDIGYDLPSAVADIVDNSVSANAGRIDIELVTDGPHSYLLIADDGDGMTTAELNEALRFGSRSAYGSKDLGRYGLGLKTASLSQCRRLTVLSRRSPTRARISVRTLDLDHILETDRWELVQVPLDSRAHRALEWLKAGRGTVVFWERLDRILPPGSESGGGASRRMRTAAERIRQHLAAVFHRFLEGSVEGRDRIVITVNGEKVRPWNPLAPDEEHTELLPVKQFELAAGQRIGTVRFTPAVLPSRDRFSSPDAWERLGGQSKWNRQQGLYIYRADRLVQSGGWCGIRAIDEHTKLARAALDFAPELDEAFTINVAKMRVGMPAEIRTLLTSEVADLCHRAQALYRHEARVRDTADRPAEAQRHTADAGSVGAALISAAFSTGTYESLEAMTAYLRNHDPAVLSALGWD